MLYELAAPDTSCGPGPTMESAVESNQVSLWAADAGEPLDALSGVGLRITSSC
jgi:hypothetical protein